ncbi:hypothetical protein DFP72DRAFT_1079098 [Ephemerocybe angulata]|uniref:Uncharacterized protein n=1 Tax=Ephemerocybe angulata TaxID=980116 RepID=A0A8H6LX96_9AGAR|nr:hypothetical protein DFP72DRAFT_1079098 [Tulosesus angulatus]
MRDPSATTTRPLLIVPQPISRRPTHISSRTRKTRNDEQAGQYLAASSERVTLISMQNPQAARRQTYRPETAITNGKPQSHFRHPLYGAHTLPPKMHDDKQTVTVCAQPHGTRLPTPSDSKHTQDTIANHLKPPVFAQPSHIHSKTLQTNPTRRRNSEDARKQHALEADNDRHPSRTKDRDVLTSIPTQNTHALPRRCTTTSKTVKSSSCTQPAFATTNKSAVEDAGERLSDIRHGALSTADAQRLSETRHPTTTGPHPDTIRSSLAPGIVFWRILEHPSNGSDGRGHPNQRRFNMNSGKMKSSCGRGIACRNPHRGPSSSHSVSSSGAAQTPSLLHRDTVQPRRRPTRPTRMSRRFATNGGGSGDAIDGRHGVGACGSFGNQFSGDMGRQGTHRTAMAVFWTPRRPNRRWFNNAVPTTTDDHRRRRPSPTTTAVCTITCPNPDARLDDALLDEASLWGSGYTKVLCDGGCEAPNRFPGRGAASKPPSKNWLVRARFRRGGAGTGRQSEEPLQHENNNPQSNQQPHLSRAPEAGAVRTILRYIISSERQCCEAGLHAQLEAQQRQAEKERVLQQQREKEREKELKEKAKEKDQQQQHPPPADANDEEARARLRALEKRVGSVEGGVKEALDIGKKLATAPPPAPPSVPAAPAASQGATWWNKIIQLRITTPDGQDVTGLITHLVDSAVSLTLTTKDTLAKPDFALHSAGARARCWAPSDVLISVWQRGLRDMTNGSIRPYPTSVVVVQLVWLESPTNPTLKLMDIARVVNLKIVRAHPAQPLLLSDNTFLSPYYSSPGTSFVNNSGTRLARVL